MVDKCARYARSEKQNKHIIRKLRKTVRYYEDKFKQIKSYMAEPSQAAITNTPLSDEELTEDGMCVFKQS